VNAGVLSPEPEVAEERVLRIRTKLHQWATEDPGRRFDDLYNLIADPAVLVVAWTRVRGNRGKRSAGVDRLRPVAVFAAEEWFLPELREDLKARRLTRCPCGSGWFPSRVPMSAGDWAYGVSKATFGYLDQYAWHRVVGWIRKRHKRAKWAVVRRRYLPGWRPTEDGVALFAPQQVTVSRYRYRAGNIPRPWANATPGTAA
jgi:hypothetical protein